MSDNKEKLIDAISAKGELKRSLKEIFGAWPNLRAVTFKLSDFMGDVVPGEKGVPLLLDCLNDAVQQFKTVRAEDFGTHKQMIAYIRGLLIKAPALVDVSIAGKGDAPDVWEPFDEPVSAFVARHGGYAVYQEPQSEAYHDSLRLMLLARIITTRDLQWIDECASLGTMLEDPA